ncbi:MAG: hypothetical protein MPN21_16700 [Thermoanaerobaculia bacterium]|nr:hypothetical protein [Thermoanaerobaculia bacterium]
MPSDPRRPVAFSFAAALAMTLLTPVEAQVLDRFELRGGGETLDADSTVRVDDGATLGTSIDFEDDLGLEGETETFSIELAFRLGKRHQLGFSQRTLDRTGERRLDQSMTFQGFTFPFDVDTESHLDLEMTGVSYTFWPFLGQSGGFGIALGAYDTEIRAGITGRATVGGVQLSHTEEASESAPLPFVGVDFRFLPSNRWRIRGQYRVLSVDDFDGWEGDLTDGTVGLDFRLLSQLWIGAAYRTLEIDVSSEEAGFTGQADLDFSGFGVYGTLTF